MMKLHAAAFSLFFTCSQVCVASQSCATVTSWLSLKEAIATSTKSGADEIVVCAFRLAKPESDMIQVKTALRLSCSVRKKCVLQGGGVHIRVQGPQAELHLSGFVLGGSTESAIQISASASKKAHHVQDCILKDNVVPAGGIGRGGKAPRAFFGARVLYAVERADQGSTQRLD